MHKGAQTMKNHWTYTLKYNANGEVVSCKARLVVKGFSQIPGVDYFAMYSSIVKYKSLQMNLETGAVLDYKIWQIDYTSMYLNAPMQVPILMEQPEGCKVKPSNVYKMDMNKGEQVWGSNGYRDWGQLQQQEKFGITPG